jgi:hypothetical protein
MVRRKATVFVVLFLLFTSVAVYPDAFTLHFSAGIETDSSEDVFPASFRALGRTASEPNSLLTGTLLAPPDPPARRNIQITTADPEEKWLRESLSYDAAGVDLLYTMSFSLNNAGAAGLSGKSLVTLENPDALEHLPPDSLVYLRRFDAGGTFVESYLLTDPANHTIQWDISEADGPYGQMDLLIVDACIAADLMRNQFINLDDFALLSDNWKRSGLSAAADIVMDNKIDFVDLSILAQQWLCSCTE